MTRDSIREYIEAVRERYLHESKKEKGRILDEFTKITGHHRKAASGRAPVYMYQFTWESPAEHGRFRSCHGLEVPFVFNNVEPPIGLIGDAPERFTLAKNMSGVWAAFARSGDPSHKGIPRWPAYTEEERATLIFNIESHVENDPHSEERKAWYGII